MAAKFRQIFLILLFSCILLMPSVIFAQASNDPSPTPSPTPNLCQETIVDTAVFNISVRDAGNFYRDVTIDTFLQTVADDAHCVLSPSQVDRLTTRFQTDHSPSPTPIDANLTSTLLGQANDPLCGTLDHACCTSRTVAQPQLGDFGCVDIFIIHFCPSDLLGGATSMIVKNMGADDMNKLGTCKQYQVDPKTGDPIIDQSANLGGFAPLLDTTLGSDGKPLNVPYSLSTIYEPNGSCSCRRSDGITNIGTEYCSKYLGSEYTIQHGVTPAPEQLKQDSAWKSCANCFSTGGHWSAFGCIHSTYWQSFLQDLMGWVIAFGGLAAFFCIIYAAFRLQTSAGNPERVKNAQQLLTSCIMGLILILFSVFILRLIGVTLLKLPGFG